MKPRGLASTMGGATKSGAAPDRALAIAARLPGKMIVSASR